MIASADRDPEPPGLDDPADSRIVPPGPAPAAPSGTDVVLAVAVFAALLVAVAGMAALLPAPVGLDEPGRLLLTTTGLLLLQNVAMLAGVGAVAWRRRTPLRVLLGLNPLGPWQVASHALLGCAIGVTLGLGLQFLQQVLDQPVRTPGAAMLAPVGFSWAALALMLTIGGLLAPLAEELMFRGILFGWLRRRVRPPVAALLSALPFGLVHVTPEHILYATTAGFLLALLYQRSGSLWAPVVAHTTINVIAIGYVYVALAAGVPLADL